MEKAQFTSWQNQYASQERGHNDIVSFFCRCRYCIRFLHGVCWHNAVEADGKTGEIRQ